MSTSVLERRMTADDAGRMLDAMVGRLSYDDSFVAAVTADPRTALEEAGLILDKDAVEAFISDNPERFDLVCDALCRIVSPDFLAAMGPTCCG